MFARKQMLTRNEVIIEQKVIAIALKNFKGLSGVNQRQFQLALEKFCSSTFSGSGLSGSYDVKYSSFEHA